MRRGEIPGESLEGIFGYAAPILIHGGQIVLGHRITLLRLLHGNNGVLRGSPYEHRSHAHKGIREPFALRLSFEQTLVRTTARRWCSLLRHPLLPDIHSPASTVPGPRPGELSPAMPPFAG